MTFLTIIINLFTGLPGNPVNPPSDSYTFSISDVAEYDGVPYCIIHDNVPMFKSSEITTSSFETYSELDSLGRCGVCTACVGKDLMPTSSRESISEITPTGWVNNKYDFIDGGYIYNRCHLLGFQLTGENANEYNLITGTRYMNVEGMLPFENMVADYVKETNEHCMYRVTPIFENNNLVASGVLMEAYSVEDKGDSICFCVYCYNVQPGVKIDYATGENKLAKMPTYIVNLKTNKFHKPGCESCQAISSANKFVTFSSREDLIQRGYSPCQICKP